MYRERTWTNCIYKYRAIGSVTSVVAKNTRNRIETMVWCVCPYVYNWNGKQNSRDSTELTANRLPSLPVSLSLVPSFSLAEKQPVLKLNKSVLNVGVWKLCYTTLNVAETFLINYITKERTSKIHQFSCECVYIYSI